MQWMTDPANEKILMLCIFVLGAFVAAAVIFWRTRRFMTHARRTTATITKLGSTRGGIIVDVRFKDGFGKTTEASRKFPYAAYTVGDEVAIWYHKDKPEIIRADTFTALWMVPILLVCVGAAAGMTLLFALPA